MALKPDARHLIVFDGTCPFCRQQVRAIYQRDHKGVFAFAPRQGQTVRTVIQRPLPEGSIVLIENYGTSDERTWIYGKGALRIYWHLPGRWRLLGLCSFLPHLLVDPPYRLIAKNRHRLAKRADPTLPRSNRFLP